jgi:hypothetical protein
MTKNDFTMFLGNIFKKWSVTENQKTNTITVKVDGPMLAHDVIYLTGFAPASVRVEFCTMNWFERRFTENRSWKVKK